MSTESPAPELALNREQRRHGDVLPTRLVTAAELAEHYGVTRPTVYNLMNRGMPSVKIGRCRRFRLAEVDAWLDAEGRES